LVHAVIPVTQTRRAPQRKSASARARKPRAKRPKHNATLREAGKR
jgi:hypothetical protein